MAYIYDLVDVWASSGTTFTGIKLSVTDTASASGSLLMDLQVGGASRFVVSKAGRVTLGSSTNLGELQFTEGIGVKVRLGSGSGQDTFAILANNGIAFKSSGVLFWSGAEDSFGATDLQLRRDAANTLAQRNGVNAQAFNLYGTYTDGSNYRRIKATMSTGGVAEIKPEGAGTGITGNVLHISGLPTSNPGPGILWNNAGTPAIGT